MLGHQADGHDRRDGPPLVGPAHLPRFAPSSSKPEKGRYLHPTGGPGDLASRGGARLQSFPDWYLFEGTKIEIARQIGNAVPPLLGVAMARYVYKHAFAPKAG